MFCTNCGIKANLGERFCGRCGRPVKQALDLITPPRPTRPTAPEFYEVLPQEMPAPQPETKPELPVASQKARLINFLFDYVGLAVYVLLVLILVAYVEGFIGIYNQTAWENAFNGTSAYLIGTIFFFSYYVFFEAVFGRTPGKAITGTKVVTADGSKPSLGSVVQRTASRFNPFELFSFFGSHHPHGWHDSVSQTYVVKQRRH